MVHFLLPSQRTLPLLLDYFLDEAAWRRFSLPLGSIIVPPQLELVIEQDDLAVRVLLDEGAWQNVISSEYGPETRRELGFTPDYFRQISAQAESFAKWRTEDGAPVVAHQHSSINVPQVEFFTVSQEPNRILFTYLGFFVTETSTLTGGKVVTEKKSFGREPIQLDYTKSTVYPQ